MPTPNWKWIKEDSTPCSLALVYEDYEPGDSQLCYHGADWPMREDIKRLIVATPKLLRACKMALKLELYPTHSTCGDSIRREDILNAIREAIKEAETED